MKIISGKIQFSIFLVSTAIIFNLSSQQAKAEAWGTNIAAALLGQRYQILYEETYGAMIGAIKNAAAEIYNSAIEELISSGGNDNSDGSSAMFITNWNDFLYTYPEKNAKLIMNDFFSSKFNGKGSSTNYKSSGGSSVSGNYISQIKKNSMQQLGLKNTQKVPCEITDSSQLFEDGDWTAYNSLYSNDDCNFMGSLLSDQYVYSQIENNLIEEAKIKAIAYQGFKPKTSGGMVITPGSTIKDMETMAKDLPNKIIAGAKKIPEVITALATRMAVSAVKQGIGNVKSNIQRETGIPVNNVTSVINNLSNSSPREYYKQEY